jgi:membrane protease YdiL (CAAX protease family)
MKSIRKNIVIWGLLIASLCAFALYFQNRENVFPIANVDHDLTHEFTDLEIQTMVSPLFDLSSKELNYRVERFVDRNSLKFLQQTLTTEAFNQVLKNENIQLWGWNIYFTKPIQATIRISQQKKLIGFDFNFHSTVFNPLNDPKQILSVLEEKTGKKFSNYAREEQDVVNNGALIKLHREVPTTKLIELIKISINRGKLDKFESQILLPNAYANNINIQIQKQKTIHYFFNIFHYLLIAIIFLFLFRSYESHKLRWRDNVYVFLVLFFAQFISNLFETRLHDAYAISILEALIKTIGYTSWIFVLIVAADFVARQFPKSNHSLSDLGKKSFFYSEQFRSNFYAGWILFVVQLVFVGIFYKIFQNYSSYVPLKIAGEHSSYCSFEFLKYFSESLSTSIYEESLYRLFLISFFSLIFKRSWIAIVISSILWGFLHFSYQFEPYYIRGLELSIIGILYGWVMVRYGILSVIIAHFLYNNYVMAEYEHQAFAYNFSVILILISLYLISFAYRKDTFVFDRPRNDNSSEPVVSADRRNLIRRIYPLSWKYGLASLAILVFVLTQIQFYPKDANPLANQQELIQNSSKIINAYTKSNTWNVTYHKHNSDIDGVFEVIKGNPRQKEFEQLLEPYSFLWSVRYFSQDRSAAVCDMHYSHGYELMSLECNDLDAPPMSFEEWIRLVKDPEETWTVFNVLPSQNGIVDYEYNVVHDSSGLTKKAFIKFRNNQLISFNKQIGINYISAKPAKPPTKYKDIASIALSIILFSFLYLFFKFLLSVLKDVRIYDKKSLYGSYISCFLFVLWKLNSYKDVIIDWNTQNSLQHYFINEILISSIKILALGFFSYLLFFAFFYFPSRVFKFVPTSAEWNGILARPIWKWRNTRVSLIYAALLLCIKTLLSVLIQINGGTGNTDFFHFDVSFLNHEYLFITFLGLMWKSLLFWVSLMIVITLLENHFPRWIYLFILALIGFLNIALADSNLDSKLIEVCALYIVFYFLYNVARLDFSFYFWFILLNTLMTFVPVLIYKQYTPYLYQVVFIFIFVSSIIFYTLIRGRRRSIKVI